MNQIWFTHLLGLDSSAARSVVDKFKNTRSILMHRNAGTLSASTITGTAEAEDSTYSATLALKLAVQSTPGPAPGFSGFQARVLPAASVQFVPAPCRHLCHIKVFKAVICAYKITMILDEATSLCTDAKFPSLDLRLLLQTLTRKICAPALLPDQFYRRYVEVNIHAST